MIPKTTASIRGSSPLLALRSEESNRHVQENRCCQSAARLAKARWKEAQRDSPLFVDLFAHQLYTSVENSDAGSSADKIQDLDDIQDSIATQYIDECLLQAISLTNEQKGDYKQVVLLGPGFDTRPLRLHWPVGTAFYSVAPSLVHELTRDALGSEALESSLSRGCSYTSIRADLLDGSSLATSFDDSGFDSTKLSVWAIQGLSGLDLGLEDLRYLIGEIGCLSSYQSLMIGEIPGMSVHDAQTILSESGFLSSASNFGDKDADYGRWADASVMPRSAKWPEQDSNRGIGRGVLFTAQHQHRSLGEMATYKAHVQAAEETDEDFFDNFS